MKQAHTQNDRMRSLIEPDPFLLENTLMIRNKTQGNALRSGLNTIIACAMLLASATSFAQSQTTWFGNVADGQWLAGVKLGVAEPSSDAFESANTATLVLGYQFSRPIGNGGSASIEFEIGTSEEEKVRFTSVGEGEWDVETVSAFLNYRSPGTVYFKAKLGMMDTSLTTKFPLGNSEFDDTGLALGFGGGVRLGSADSHFSLEAEWISSSDDEDINFYNLGLIFEF